MSILNISALYEGHTIVTLEPELPLSRAVQLMREKKYSQLPVIDQSGQYEGLLTWSAIFTALQTLNCTITQLKVKDVLLDAGPTCESDADLSWVLQNLTTNEAVVVLDNQKMPIGIITIHDTSAFLRDYSQDIMHAQDIELTLKDYVLAVHQNSDGNIDTDLLQLNINRVRKAHNQGMSMGLISSYLERLGLPALNEAILNEILDIEPSEIIDFEGLSLGEYIELWLQNDYDKRIPSEQSLPTRSLRTNIFDPVRKTRNAIAHLRDLTSEQQQVLRYCIGWLKKNGPKTRIVATIETDNAEALVSEAIELDKQSDSTIPYEEIDTVEDAEVGSSKYAPLAHFLRRLPKDRISLRFDQIEQIINTELPPNAREHRSWWANDSVSHTQSQQWLSADWRVTSVNMQAETVAFERNRERHQAYINFYSPFLEKLRSAKPKYPTKDALIQGTSWVTISGFRVRNNQKAYLMVAFTQDKRFRIEIYIDTGKKDENKQVFAELENKKDEIERELGESLSWELLPNARASRIACYYPDTAVITKPENHELIRDWAVNTMVNFQNILGLHVEAALKNVVS